MCLLSLPCSVALRQNEHVKTPAESYKVIRALPDGQRVSVGTFRDVEEARKVIVALSEYWPGDYRILQPSFGEHGRAAPVRAA